MTKEKKELFQEGREEFPVSTMVVENLFIFLWMTLGAFLCWQFEPLVGWIYLAFGFTMVLVVMRILVCKNCYYHGKRCHTGWGKLSALYCEQGEVERFGCGAGGAIVPMFYGSMALLPLVLGTITTVKAFTLIKIIQLAVFLFIVVMSSFTLRKKACAVCKMKNICPGSAA